jgi:hypothetical protein
MAAEKRVAAMKARILLDYVIELGGREKVVVGGLAEVIIKDSIKW